MDGTHRYWLATEPCGSQTLHDSEPHQWEDRSFSSTTRVLVVLGLLLPDLKPGEKCRVRIERCE